jgi:hypothetical protein
MKDFWLSCGHHLLDRDAGGGLVVTDEFLKAYLARPELAPPANACVVEKTLHGALLADPHRDHLVRHPTIEAAYLALIRNGIGRTPPLFVNQLVHLILRNVLDDCDDPVVLRAAELFFRPQLLTLHEGSLIAADEETLAGANDVHISPLVSMMGLPASGEVEVISAANGNAYFDRSDRFDMALDLTAGRDGHAALAQALTRWIAHLLATEVTVEPVSELRDVDFRWYVGLDAEATRIGDTLWKGEEFDEAAQSQVIGLYRLTFPDAGAVAPSLQGDPVYLLLAMTPDRRLRMKPQNLIVGLPIRHLEAVS